MKQRYLSHITAETCRDVGTVQAWLEEDLNTCINRKKDDFIAVIRAIARSSENKDRDVLNAEFSRIMNERWLGKIFEQGDRNGPLALGPNIIMEALSQMLLNDHSRVKNTITGIFRFVLAEDEHAKSDSLQAERKKAGKKK